MKPLEDVPEGQKDWHPGTNNRILNLVYPLDYCLVYDRTLAFRLNSRSGVGRRPGDLQVVKPPVVTNSNNANLAGKQRFPPDSPYSDVDPK